MSSKVSVLHNFNCVIFLFVQERIIRIYNTFFHWLSGVGIDLCSIWLIIGKLNWFRKQYGGYLLKELQPLTFWSISGREVSNFFFFLILLHDQLTREEEEVMVFNATFNNSVLLVEETGVPWENHWQTLLHDVVSSTPWVGFDLETLVAIGTDCIDSCKSNYHTITTMTAPS